MNNTAVLQYSQKQSRPQLDLQDCAAPLQAFIQLKTALVQMWSRSVAACTHLYYQDLEPLIEVSGRVFLSLFYFCKRDPSIRCQLIFCHKKKVCIREQTENWEMKKKNEDMALTCLSLSNIKTDAQEWTQALPICTKVHMKLMQRRHISSEEFHFFPGETPSWAYWLFMVNLISTKFPRAFFCEAAL